MSIYIVYGSETGTAQGLAEKAHGALSAKGLEAVVHPADKLNPSSLKAGDSLVVFTCTYGSGEAPANAEGLLKGLAGGSYSLAGIKSAVFGIGSSSFPDFCKTADDFEAALEVSGAERITRTVKSDEGSYEADLEKWLAAYPA